MKQRDFVKKCAFLSMFLALALILSYVESLIFPVPSLPGVKLGLPNLIVVLLLYAYGPKEALLVNIMRILLSGFLFGSLSSILYSLAGGLLSFLCMFLLRRTKKFGLLGVSVAGGVSHNLGQLCAAVFVTRTAAIAYIGVLLVLFGCVTGMLIGVCASLILPRIGKEGKG